MRRRKRSARGWALAVLLLLSVPAYAASRSPDTVAGTGNAAEARRLQVELNRLGSSGDPIERESLLRRIIDVGQGTEEGEAAYWALADLYLDAFPEPREDEARGVLELFLKRCPGSSWAAHTRCRLLGLYDEKDKRAGELRRELGQDKELPQLLRAALRL